MLNSLIMDECLWPEKRQAFDERRAAPPDVATDALAVSSLTAAMTRGDEAAYREFYRRYFPRLLRYLLVVSQGNEEEAREALQLTLLRVVRYIKSFPNDEVLWSWLTVLARSSAKDERRKQRRYFGFLGRLVRRTHKAESHSSDEADTLLESALERALSLLSAEDRDVIERKYFQGERVSQMASTLRTTDKALESRLVRVRRKLKESIMRELKQ